MGGTGWEALDGRHWMGGTGGTGWEALGRPCWRQNACLRQLRRGASTALTVRTTKITALGPAGPLNLCPDNWDPHSCTPHQPLLSHTGTQLHTELHSCTHSYIHTPQPHRHTAAPILIGHTGTRLHPYSLATQAHGCTHTHWPHSYTAAPILIGHTGTTTHSSAAVV